MLSAILNVRTRRSARRRAVAKSFAAETLEVRTLLTADPFQQYALYATTVMPQADDRFTMQVGNWDDDSVSDVFTIRRSGTESGKVEVAVYSAKFPYFDARHDGQATAWIALFPTGLNAVNADWEFRIDNWGAGSKPDLFAIQKANTASGFVEVTVFTGESNFESSSGAFLTPLPTAGRDWTFDVGHCNADGVIDLFAIRRNGDIRTELAVASGMSSPAFSGLLIQTVTPLPPTNSTYDFVVTDLGNDGVPDLLGIRKHGTEFGRIELNVMPGAVSPSGTAAFRWFSTRSLLRTPDTAFDWKFDTAYFNSPFASDEDGVVDLIGLQKLASGPPDMHFLSGVPNPATAVFGEAAVPASALFTTAAQTTTGLTGSYVNTSLRAYSTQDDWRTTQTIAGSRVDTAVNFTGNSLGSRSAVGITGGSDANWENFSVQWDGYLSIPSDGVHVRTNGSDGNRMWIDINGDGQFASSGIEYLNNSWGKAQEVTAGPASIQLTRGVYRIRLQFEDVTGPNPMQLLWDFMPAAVPASAYFVDSAKATRGIIGAYIDSNLRDASAALDWRAIPGVPVAGTRNDPAINFPTLSLGIRSSVGLTSGSDTNWDSFSVQWDGYVVIPANGIRLYLRTDDSSRAWIDVNGDGVFSSTSAEFLNNNFGTGQPTTVSGPGPALAAGTYRIRMQYEEGQGGNLAQLLWDYHPIQRSSVVITGVGSTSQYRPDINWTPVAGAAGYDIWIDNLTTKTSAIVRALTPENWYTPNASLGIGQYGVWVRSIDINGLRSAWSPRFVFRIVMPVLVKPMALMQSTARPTLRWESLQGAARYDLWIDNLTTNQAQFVRLNTITGTQWTPSSDLPMGRYRFWVRGIDAEGVAATWSASKDFTVVPPPVPTAPLLPTFDRTPTMTWEPVLGAASYQLTLKEPGTSGQVLYAPVNLTETNWTVPADLAIGDYDWWVISVSADAFRSEPLKVNRFNTGGRPSVLTPTGTTSNRRPEFTWTAVTNAVSYELWVNRLDVPTTAIINVTGITEPRYTPPTAMAAGTYRYWVRAVSNTGVTSAWSAALDFRIVGILPDLLPPSGNQDEESVFVSMLDLTALTLMLQDENRSPMNVPVVPAPHPYEADEDSTTEASGTPAPLPSAAVRRRDLDKPVVSAAPAHQSR
jgi:hypothetical protein